MELNFWTPALGLKECEQADSLLVACSEVHRARSRKTGTVVAMKKIIMHHEKDGVRILLLRSHLQPSDLSQFPITALREIKLLKLLSHENIIRLEDMAVEHPTRASKNMRSASAYSRSAHR